MGGFHAVVLAAGQGTRMKSARSKVLHTIAGRSLVGHVLATARNAGAGGCSLVVPPSTSEFDAVEAEFAIVDGLFVQSDRLGTAHAVLQARENLKNIDDPVIVLYGDTPLLQPENLIPLVKDIASGAHLAVLGFETRTPYGYGRFIKGGASELHAIVEEKDATAEQRAITLCNSGIMAFQGDVMLKLLDRIGNANAAGEYYLTDAVAIARAVGLRVVYRLTHEDDVRGVNTRKQLAEAEAIMQTRLRDRAMSGGATLVDPVTVTFSHDTIVGQDVLIEPQVFFGCGVVIGDDVTIKGFSHIEGTHLKRGASVGPFARLRPDTIIESGARVGNFVEIKESTLHEGAKVSHLSYIGDATIGRDANVGAGVITCNFDGHAKHRTEIGADAFIGSNSALVAPVTIGVGAVIGAGSTITKNVPANALALTRAPLFERVRRVDPNRKIDDL